MKQKTRQTTAILLSLLLVLLPMQSAFAGIMSLDQSADHFSHSLMDMEHGASMSGGEDCTHFSENNACDKSDCSSGHCSACVAGILGDVQASLNISNHTQHPFKNYSVLTKLISSLYRPPRG